MTTTNSSKNKGTVLIVSFHFPPTNSIAAVRMGKFAKYLNRLGWDVIALTVHKVKGFPPTLPLEIDEAHVARTKYFGIGSSTLYNLTGDQKSTDSAGKKSIRITFFHRLAHWVEPFYSLPLIRLLLVEPIGWYAPALKTGRDILKKHRVDVIFSSYGPAMSHIIASKLSGTFHIRWVAEFRDLWTQSHYFRKIQPLHFLEQRIEKKVINSASRLVAIADPMSEQLKGLHGKKTITIHNGFDEEDYREHTTQTAKFTITYTGRLIGGKRDPKLLFEAIADLAAEGKISPDNFEIRFFGDNSIAGILSPMIKAYNVSNLVNICGFVPFKESLKRQQESTILLLLLWANHDEEKGVYTGKVFEYLGARRPILAIGPKDGVVDKLLAESGTGIVVNKVEEIKHILGLWLEEFGRLKTITSSFNPNKDIVSHYTRKKQTEKLALVLSEAINQDNYK